MVLLMKADKGPKKGCEKVVLSVDGHKSHTSLKSSEFAKEKNIKLFCIIPNATHLLQTLDLGTFKPLNNN